MQLVFAGNDSQGLRYGTVTTREEFFVEWKAASTAPLHRGALLDRPLAEMCEKSRLLDLIRNFIIFDGGIKKVPRPHQFAGVKAAQERIRKREGGVIWHTQGSGKSILMVLLAKWLLEHDPEARILVVTDRDELDKQIEGVMKNAGVIGENSPSPRITSRAEFVAKLGATTPRLLCALIHKFDPADLKGPPPPVHGRFYVFVDECHRTQGGDMNKQMKRWLENAIFIGFTGTPLLNKEQQAENPRHLRHLHPHLQVPRGCGGQGDSRFEIRGPRCAATPHLAEGHRGVFRAKDQNAEQFSEGHPPQTLGDDGGVDERRASASSASSPASSTTSALKPRLNNDRGTAILVAASIYDACHYYRLFQNTAFRPILRHHHVLRAEPQRHLPRAGQQRRTLQVRHLHQARPEERPDHQGLRGRSQAPLHRRTGQPQAADRGEQAPDRLRRAELHLHLPR